MFKKRVRSFRKGSRNKGKGNGTNAKGIWNREEVTE